MKRFDLVLLSETWSRNTDNYALKSFRYHDFHRTSKHPLALRDSGGLGIFISNRLNKGMTIYRNYKDISVWLTIDKSYSGLEKDIYIANLYFSPETSTHVEDDPFAILQGDIAGLPNDCYIL